MTRLGLWMTCGALMVAGFGCGSSKIAGEEDMGGITFDAGLDARVPTDATTPRGGRTMSSSA